MRNAAGATPTRTAAATADSERCPSGVLVSPFGLAGTRGTVKAAAGRDGALTTDLPHRSWWVEIMNGRRTKQAGAGVPPPVFARYASGSRPSSTATPASTSLATA